MFDLSINRTINRPYNRLNCTRLIDLLAAADARIERAERRADRAIERADKAKSAIAGERARADALRDRAEARRWTWTLARAALDQAQTEARKAHAEVADCVRRTTGRRGGLWRGSGRRGGGNNLADGHRDHGGGDDRAGRCADHRGAAEG